MASTKATATANRNPTTVKILRRSGLVGITLPAPYTRRPQTRHAPTPALAGPDGACPDASTAS